MKNDLLAGDGSVALFSEAGMRKSNSPESNCESSNIAKALEYVTSFVRHNYEDFAALRPKKLSDVMETDSNPSRLLL